MLNISATNASLYSWTPINTFLNYDTILNPICTPLTNIDYKISVSSSKGCISTKSVFVRLNKEINIVNAFSPNGDGINDLWDISSFANYAGASVKVFDRGGTIVYQSQNLNNRWNGMKNGQSLPVGVYYYIIDVPNYRMINGSLTLLK